MLLIKEDPRTGLKSENIPLWATNITINDDFWVRIRLSQNRVFFYNCPGRESSNGRRCCTYVKWIWNRDPTWKEENEKIKVMILGRCALRCKWIRIGCIGKTEQPATVTSWVEYGTGWPGGSKIHYVLITMMCTCGWIAQGIHERIVVAYDDEINYEAGRTKIF